MQTQLTTKGQLVIPKPIRDALALGTGTKFDIQIDNGSIVLKPTQAKTNDLGTWQPRNPAGASLSTDELCEPVNLAD